MNQPAAALASRLAALIPADAAEERHRGEFMSLLGSAPRPFSPDQFEPGHVTGSAFVVAPDARAVLFVLHTALQRWLQPGGHMEPGESDPLVTAVRETAEETGLRVLAEPAPFDVDVHAIPARGAFPAHRHFDVRYLGIVRGLPPASAGDVDAARWFSRAEADALDLDAGVRRMLRKAAGRGLL